MTRSTPTSGQTRADGALALASGPGGHPSTRSSDHEGSRQQILEAVLFTAERFLTASSWEACAEEVLGRLGEATGGSRVYVYRNHRDREGALLMSGVVEWTAKGIRPTFNESQNQGAPYSSKFHRWEETLASGGVIRGLTRDFPEPERASLADEDIRSIAVVPVMVGEDFWGYMGFDDCERARDWSGPEIDALRAAAQILGAAIGRQEADRAREEAEANYRHLVEQIPAVTYIDSYAGEDKTRPSPVYISPQVERMFGYPRSAWLTDPDMWLRLLHPEDREHVPPNGWRTTADGSFSVEYRMVHRDGRTVWIREEAAVTRDDPSGPEIWQGVLYDITELKQAQDARWEAESKYRSLVERLPGVVYVAEFGESGEWVYVSPRIEDVFGYTPDEWMSHEAPWTTHVHPDDLDRALADERRSRETGQPLSSVYRMFTRDGKLCWIEDEALLVRDEEDVPRYWHGMMVDITERKQVEEALREKDRQVRRLFARLVEAQEEERSRIASDIHDDPVQKMTAVGIRLEALKGRLPEGYGESVGTLQEAVSAAIARLRNLMFELRPPALDREGLEAALRQHLKGAEEEGGNATVVSRLDREPPPETRVIAYRIAQEALSNVRKHARATNVSVALESRSGGLFVRIEDDGVGMPTAVAEQPQPGHMGLQSMRERAELPGGWFRIRSAPGRGTKVEFWLPNAA